MKQGIVLILLLSLAGSLAYELTQNKNETTSEEKVTKTDKPSQHVKLAPNRVPASVKIQFAKKDGDLCDIEDVTDGVVTVFGLPYTHQIKIRPSDDNYCETLLTVVPDDTEEQK